MSGDETCAQLMFEQESILVVMTAHHGEGRGCCLVSATGDSLQCGRFLLAPLSGNKEGSKSRMVLRVRPTLTQLPTSIIYTPMDSTYSQPMSGV